MTQTREGILSLSGRADVGATGMSNVGFNLRTTDETLGTQIWREYRNIDQAVQVSQTEWIAGGRTGKQRSDSSNLRLDRTHCGLAATAWARESGRSIPRLEKRTRSITRPMCRRRGMVSRYRSIAADGTLSALGGWRCHWNLQRIDGFIRQRLLRWAMRITRIAESVLTELQVKSDIEEVLENRNALMWHELLWMSRTFVLKWIGGLVLLGICGLKSRSSQSHLS